MHVVVYEDRAQHLVGARLAVASLLREVEDAEVVLRCPRADEDLASWCDERPRVRLDTTPLAASGWDVKPSVLLAELQLHDEVVWMDSDVVVWGDLAARLRQAPPTALVVAGETALGQALGGDHRTRAWGLDVGRPLPTTANTGLVRANRSHRPLLEAWQALLVDERYRRAQASGWQERPLHLLGDQEVLTGLLGSARFSDVDVEVLAQGVDIAQCFGPAGWTPAARLAGVRRGSRPVLVHAMGHRKPYAPGRAPGGVLGTARHAYEALHHRLTPYGAVAATYAADVGGPLPWARAAGGWRRACLRELPLALVDLAVRRGRSVVGAGRYAVEGGPATA